MKLPTWAYLIIFLTVAGTLAFDCTAPLPAAAAIAGLNLSRSQALVTATAAWFLTQVAGFAMMGYPFTVDAFGWGAAIGLATVTAAWTTSMHQRTYMALVAFAAYELTLASFALMFGGLSTFTPAIVGGLFLVNLIGFFVLFLVWLVAREFQRNWSNV